MRVGLLCLALALPQAAWAQSGMGTGGARSGNYTGGVSDPVMPRDKTAEGREQMAGESPLGSADRGSVEGPARDPDARRAQGALAPEEGIRFHWTKRARRTPR